MEAIKPDGKMCPRLVSHLGPDMNCCNMEAGTHPGIQNKLRCEGGGDEALRASRTSPPVERMKENNCSLMVVL